MTEVLVRVEARINKQTPGVGDWRVGDVVDIRPDGWRWGVLTRSDPRVRILRISGLSRSDQATLLSQEISANNDPRARRRRFHLDVAKMPTISSVLSLNGVKTRTKVVDDVPLTEARGAITLKAPR